MHSRHVSPSQAVELQRSNSSQGQMSTYFNLFYNILSAIMTNESMHTSSIVFCHNHLQCITSIKYLIELSSLVRISTT
ncbi:uncharacterized protein DS421_9g276590 [Arachis hypogaea]|nr:uncharacterized protein DS421_9g276590 [Arachis hypogaea]